MSPRPPISASANRLHRPRQAGHVIRRNVATHVRRCEGRQRSCGGPLAAGRACLPACLQLLTQPTWSAVRPGRLRNNTLRATSLAPPELAPPARPWISPLIPKWARPLEAEAGAAASASSTSEKPPCARMPRECRDGKDRTSLTGDHRLRAVIIGSIQGSACVRSVGGVRPQSAALERGTGASISAGGGTTRPKRNAHGCPSAGSGLRPPTWPSRWSTLYFRIAGWLLQSLKGGTCRAVVSRAAPMAAH